MVKMSTSFSVTLQGLLKIRCRHPALDFTRNRISWSFWPTEKAGRAVFLDSLPGARVQRCGSPVATSKGRRYFEAPTEPTGETAALCRESRGNALPSDMMLCVISTGYYLVLSGIKWRQIQQLRCCALSRQAVEMKESPAKPYTKIRKK